MRCFLQWELWGNIANVSSVFCVGVPTGINEQRQIQCVEWCKCQVKMSKNAHLKCTILSGQSVVGIIKNITAFNTVRMAGDFDNITVMNQTVNDGVGNDSVSEDIEPF